MAKFCTKCGRKLAEGEVCNCTQARPAPSPEQTQGGYNTQAGQPQPGNNSQTGQPNYGFNPQMGQPQPDNSSQAAQPNYNSQGIPYNQGGFNGQGATQKNEQVIKHVKNMFSEMLPILKRPVTETKRIASEKNSLMIGLEFMCLKALIILIIVLICTNKISTATGGLIELPYFSIILTALLATIGLDALDAALLKVFAGAFKGTTTMGAMFSVVGARAFYDAILAVLVGFFALFSAQFSLILFTLGSVILPYIEYGPYQVVVQADENKKLFAFCITKICLPIACYLVFKLTGEDIISGLVSNAFNSFMF